MRRVIAPVVFLFLCSFPLPPAAVRGEDVVEMKVKRVMLDPSIKTPTGVVILESREEKKLMPIWIGSGEATSIAIEMEHVSAPRPNSHDLIRNILEGIGAELHRITITDLRNNIYYARITLRLRGKELEIDSRPSDAIAVALRMKSPIYASAQVLAKARRAPSSEVMREGFRKILGIHAQNLTPELAALFDLPAKKGVLVADVEAGSAASKAGIQRGDVILRIDNRNIEGVDDLESFFRRDETPVQIKVEVLKEGRTTTVVVDLPS